MITHFSCSFWVKFKKTKQSHCSQQSFGTAPGFLVSPFHLFLLQQGRGSTSLGEFLVVVILPLLAFEAGVPTSAEVPTVQCLRAATFLQYFGDAVSLFHLGAFWCQMENFFVVKYFICCMPRQFSFILHFTNLMTTYSSIQLLQEFVPLICQISFFHFSSHFRHAFGSPHIHMLRLF